MNTSDQIKTGILTISDRASEGIYPDEGGPGLRKAAEGLGWPVIAATVVPDDKVRIQNAIHQQIASGCWLILTTGGTGLTLRDVTPEAVREIAVTEVPGFGECMRMNSLKVTPHAILSRALAVVVERTLVLCLPGKPSAAVECLGFVAEAIPHAVVLLRDKSANH
jgi:molybdopterin adenylyltransferase